MAIQVKVYQDKRRNSNHLYYGRAYHVNTINRDQLADRIQANCSVKKSDVVAVLTELVEVMGYELANSNQILLDGFGYFYIGCRTSGAIAKEDWTIQENLKGFRVGFKPTSSRTNGKVTSKTFITGLKAAVIDLAETKKKDDDDDGE